MYKKNPLYPNVEAEIVRAQITRRDLAKALGINERTLYNKLSGKTELTLSEARIICAYLERKTGRVMTIKYLFNFT